MNLSDLLKERAQKSPGNICIKFGDRKLSFAQIDGLVSSAAGGLKGAGLKAGERAAILMENSPEYIVSYFGTIRAGGVVVPVNTFLTPDEVIYILNDSACKVLIYSEGFSGHVEKIKTTIDGLKVLRFDELRGYKDESAGPAGSAGPDDIAVFLYTSGTTGFPKGAMLTHRNLISNAEACRKVFSLSHKDRILLFLPLFHAFSFTVCVILPIYSGATIVLLKSVKPFSRIIRSILRDRISYFVAVPTVYNILSRKKIPPLLRYIFRFVVNIKVCISGAAALPGSTIKEFEKRFRLPLLEGYGLTEASPAVAVNPVRGKRKISSVGPPLPGIEVRVVDENDNDKEVGETGELIIRGPNVMKGYHNNDAETASVLKNGWLRTGDMARMDEDGYIYIMDRKKDLIIVDGMNIYPREVEEFVVKHPLVEECSMVGIPDGRGSEVSILFVKKAENAVVGEPDLREYMKGRLARFKVPKKIIFVEEFPRTSTGKIKKTELRKKGI